MVIAKCGKCGKEYQLKSDEKLSNFQCKCGGELTLNGRVSETVEPIKTKKTHKSIWEEQSKGSKIGRHSYFTLYRTYSNCRT